MRSRLIGTVVTTAALSSCLCLGAMQLLASSPASAATSSVQAPTDNELLQQIADNTAQTNTDLTNINNNVKALLKSDKKVSVNTDNSALRLKIVNSNLVALHNQLKSIFAYRGPKTDYRFNALSDRMAGLCSTEGELAPDHGPIVSLPPCGIRRLRPRVTLVA